jgi:hypothetical protein
MKTGINKDGSLAPQITQTRYRGRNDAEYQIYLRRGSNDIEYRIYLHCANDGKGGDINRGGAPLMTYEEWLYS